MVKWYDRKRLYRLDPDILTYVSATVQDYKTQHATAVPASGTTQPPGTEAASPQPEQTD
jgi:hypothetical protein